MDQDGRNAGIDVRRDVDPHPDDPQIEFRFVTSRNAMVNAFYRRGVRAEQALPLDLSAGNGVRALSNAGIATIY